MKRNQDRWRFSQIALLLYEIWTVIEDIRHMQSDQDRFDRFDIE